MGEKPSKIPLSIHMRFTFCCEIPSSTVSMQSATYENISSTLRYGKSPWENEKHYFFEDSSFRLNGSDVHITNFASKLGHSRKRIIESLTYSFIDLQNLINFEDSNILLLEGVQENSSIPTSNSIPNIVSKFKTQTDEHTILTQH